MMDKATAIKMVDNHAEKILEYNSKDGRFIFGELQDARKTLIDALTQSKTIDDLKDAFMEGIAVYELGEIDGEPLSYETKEKCWEMSDAKNLFNTPVTTDSGEKVKEQLNTQEIIQKHNLKVTPNRDEIDFVTGKRMGEE